MNQAILDKINLDTKARKSVIYAMARSAIEEACKNRHDKREAKQVVIEYLKGHHVPGRVLANGVQLHSSVVFADKSIAKF